MATPAILNTNLASVQSRPRMMPNMNNASKKTLHLFKRKEEQKRIERENLKIAQKIFQMKPSIRQFDLEMDFQKHR